MPPNPSKVMAPVQMQTSPIHNRMQPRDHVIDIASLRGNGREKVGHGKFVVKDRGHVQSQTVPCRVGGSSPKSAQSVCKSPSNVQSASKPKKSNRGKGMSGNVSPSVKPGQGQYNGRKSISPDADGSYAGAKFSEAPTPDRLPMPPPRWLSSFSEGKKIKSCPQLQPYKTTNGHSGFDDIARDLKMMLKVES